MSTTPKEELAQKNNKMCKKQYKKAYILIDLMKNLAKEDK